MLSQCPCPSEGLGTKKTGSNTLFRIQTILALSVLAKATWAAIKETTWYNLSCLLQTYCHLSTNEKLSVSWHFLQGLWCNQLWQLLEKECATPVLGVCPSSRFFSAETFSHFSCKELLTNGNPSLKILFGRNISPVFMQRTPNQGQPDT